MVNISKCSMHICQEWGSHYQLSALLTADHLYWSFVVIKALARSLSPQVLGPPRVPFLLDILPWPPQRLWESLYSFFISTMLDSPSYITLEVYEQDVFCSTLYRISRFFKQRSSSATLSPTPPFLLGEY